MKRVLQGILYTNLYLAMAMATVIVLAAYTSSPAEAQTVSILHNFTFQTDGALPTAGITFDQQGRIYGTASAGGSHQGGVVYRLTHAGEGWVLSPLYSFGSQEEDGNSPYARVIFGSDGLLYGTTNGGGPGSSGTVFSLRPPATACKSTICPWIETVLYSFTGGADGANPGYGDLTFDRSGNVYGTTIYGGSSGDGVVFKLSRSGTSWTESVVWRFTGHSDGGDPLGGVIFDNAGNLYGTTCSGGSNFGTIYELSPTESGWTEKTLYSFSSNDGGCGAGGLVMDAQGNLFGMTGGFSTGAAYELMQQKGNWSFTLLQTFAGVGYPPTLAPPTFDAQGNLYGPLPSGGDGFGEIFKLTPSGNQWLSSDYHQFATCNNGSGCFPIGAVAFDATGNMYGTTFEGGSAGSGTVWEITP